MNAISQTNNNLKAFREHISKSKELNKINLFSESIKEAQFARTIAVKNYLEQETIEASITIGELMRRTQNYEKGLEILYGIKNSIKYPQLHSRKLGRIAAIYAEGAPFFENKYNGKIQIKDSTAFYVLESLKIAVKYNLKNEEASSRNELGFFLLQQNKNEEAIKQLEIASTLFWEIGDTLNYIVVGVNQLDYYLKTGKKNEFDKHSFEFIRLSKNKKWYTAEARVFKTISDYYLKDNDSIQYYKWMDRANSNYLKYAKAISSDQMKSFEVMYETEKFQNRAVISELKTVNQSKFIEKEVIKSNYLLMILSFVFLLLLIIIFVFIRERKTKSKIRIINKELHLSNEKYQLLIIESNHRIKNNLQMVISMLNYAEQDIIEFGPKAIESISNKIHIISSLHKHLYSDIHNPLIEVGNYFDEIVILYKQITSFPITISCQIDAVRLKSERVVYFGLILNELLANSIEHNTTTLLTIAIKVKKQEDYYIFSYCDYSTHEHTNENGLGSLLILQLIKRIEGSDFQLDKVTGHYQFYFYA